MKTLVPDYYPQFSCIAGACRHSCCVGWEIDIDEKTNRYYQSLPGTFGERLRQHIQMVGGIASFRLCGDTERCPFLNEGGLCDLILALGEDALCQICTDHPRFIAEYSSHTEIGLGLCCEAAARLVLSKPEPVSMILWSDDSREALPLDDAEVEMLACRETVISALQNRTLPLSERLRTVCVMLGTEARRADPDADCTFLLSLEILDAAWKDMLEALLHMAQIAPSMPECSAEQFLVYLVYRHFPKQLQGEDAGVLWQFCMFSYELVSALYAAAPQQDMQILYEIVRMFSAEIEYSEDNLYAILDMLSETKP